MSHTVLHHHPDFLSDELRKELQAYANKENVKWGEPVFLTLEDVIIHILGDFAYASAMSEV